MVAIICGSLTGRVVAKAGRHLVEESAECRVCLAGYAAGVVYRAVDLGFRRGGVAVEFLEAVECLLDLWRHGHDRFPSVLILAGTAVTDTG
jgi:hypothetical protein